MGMLGPSDMPYCVPLAALVSPMHRHLWSDTGPSGQRLFIADGSGVELGILRR